MLLLFFQLLFTQDLSIVHHSPVVKKSFTAEAWVHHYDFHHEKGGYIRFKISDFTQALVGKIIKDDKTLLGVASYDRNDFIISFPIPESGNYHLRIEPMQANPVEGSYRIQVLEKFTRQEYITWIEEQKCLPEAVWLEKNAKDIRTLNPDDEDFSDLHFLKAAIGDKRFVFLGEANHTSGSTLAGKARLVKYLHQELGFNDLVFEGGGFEIFHLEKLYKEGDHDPDLWKEAIFPVWAYTEEGKLLTDYIRRPDKHELRVYGMDYQLIQGFNKEFVTQLLNYIEKIGIEPQINDEQFWGLLHEYTSTYQIKNPWPESIKSPFLSNILKLRDEINKYDPNSHDGKFWQQFLRSLHAKAPVRLLHTKTCSSWFTISNKHRDYQMAQNLIWLDREIFPNKKVIIWGATMHFMRNIHLIRTALGKPLNNYLSMGEIFSQQFAHEMYTIGFTNYEGIHAWDTSISKKNSFLRSVINPDQDERLELEELFFLIGKELAYIDFNRMENTPSWFHEPFLSRAMGDLAFLGPWPEMLDGLFFVRESTPVNRQ